MEAAPEIITPEHIFKMAPLELKGYIKNRLSRECLNPPAPEVQESKPEDFFVQVFKTPHKLEFEVLFVEQIIQLFEEAKEFLDDPSKEQTQYFLSLLQTAHMLDIYEASPILWVILTDLRKREIIDNLKEVLLPLSETLIKLLKICGYT